jgi:cyclophilin family peptidyl-prolyl cis-trans isomerase/HEAT repeat protein
MNRPNGYIFSKIGHCELMLPFLILLLIPSISCGDRKVRNEIARHQFFAESLKRQYCGGMQSEEFFARNLLANPYTEVRQWSAIALGRIASRKSLLPLYQSLRTGDAAVRAASAFAIGEIEERAGTENRLGDSDFSAATELTRLLDDPALLVRRRAVEALGKIGSYKEASEIIRRLEYSDSNQPETRAYLESSITALARIKDPAASPSLAKLAGSEDPVIRWRALDALIQNQSKSADSLFVKNLDNPDPDVRIYAARGLGLVGDPRLAALLLPLLPPRQAQSSDSIPLTLRCAALQALGEIKNPSAIPSIEAALSAEPIDPAHPDQMNFAMEAADTLGRMGAREGEQAILMLLKLPSPVADHALVSLAKILKGNSDRFFSLVDRSRFAATSNIAWARAMGELEDPGAMRDLNQMLVSVLERSSASETLPAILTALAKTESPGLQDILPPFFDSRDAALLRAAVAAYQPKAGAKTPWAPIVHAFESSSAISDIEARVDILSRLEPWIGERQVQQALQTCLLDPDCYMRRACAAMLRKAGVLDIRENSSSNRVLSDAIGMALAITRKNSTIAIVETNRGTLEIELFREDAPLTVANFVEMAKSEAYDEMELSQAPQERLVHGTLPRARQKSARSVNAEVNMRPFERGSIGMALAGGRSNTGRLFIALAPQPYLDGIQTCFGRVVSGMQVADRIVAGDRIKHISIKETITFLDYRRY